MIRDKFLFAHTPRHFYTFKTRNTQRILHKKKKKSIKSITKTLLYDIDQYFSKKKATTTTKILPLIPHTLMKIINKH